MSSFKTVVVFLLSLSSFANIIGTNVQNFNPTCDGLDFVTVQSPMTLKPCYMNLGVFINHAANSLNSALDNQGTATEINDELTYADFNIGLGVAKNLSIGLSFPVLLSQEIKQNRQNVLFSKEGPTEIRGNIKYNFWRGKAWHSAFILTVNKNLIKNNPYVGRDAGPVINTEFSLGTRKGSYAFAFNLGHRFRDPGTPLGLAGIQPIQNQWIASGAINKTLNPKFKIIGELLASIPTKVQSGFTRKERSSYEFLGGARYRVMKKLDLHGGAGIGIIDQTRSPDWRIYAGVNWRVGPLCSKKKKMPAPKVVKPEYQPKRYRLKNLNFRTDKHKLYPESLEKLKRFILVLKKNGENIRKIIIEGHTDSQGSADYNERLSQARAAEIRRIALKYSINPGIEIVAVGKGEYEPISDNSTPRGRAMNRRVEVLVFE